MASTVTRRIFWASAFAIAFALVEAAVVVYLRALYYPGGFAFPLSVLQMNHLVVEIAREAATVLMLASVGLLVGRSRWQKLGFFLITFAVWDIFYYIWLKVFLDWPSSLVEWDVLFLIPIPWIGPVIAPALISVELLLAGSMMVIHEGRSPTFRVQRSEALVTLLATCVMLYTFLADTSASLSGAPPEPYNYALLGAGLAGYGIVLIQFWRRIPKVPAAHVA